MELVFALITYLGFQVVDTSFFRSIDDCKYFATRLNNQPRIPNRSGNDNEPKTKTYISVCEPRKIDTKNNKVY